MKLTVTVKLQPTEEQARSLRETIERANDAAKYVSEWAWQNRTFGQYTLQKALYFRLKDEFGLSAQIVVRLIAKVADAYKLDKKTKRTFRRLGSIGYDSRILTWYQVKSEVTINTLSGRIRISYLSDERARRLLLSQQGETDLVLKDGAFYLATTVNAPEPPEQGKPEGWLGVDMGIVNIAVDSEGNVYSGAVVKNVRYRNRRLRTKLQSKRSKAAKRLLKMRNRRETRFAAHTNHVISKSIVATAKALNHGIAIEELGGIRDRVTVRHSQRATLHSWSFFQLRSFITYKAELAGVAVQAVDPKNTSRTCLMCGCIDKANRRTQSQFLCVGCGYAANADTNAARIISGRAAHVSQPYFSKPLHPLLSQGIQN
ncbi:MAG: transposase [Chloroflexota bacterium]